MLEQTHRLLLNELVDHVGKDGSNSVESLISLANVLKAKIIEQNLLDNEDSNGLTEFATSFHDAQAERNDLGAKPKHCRHGWKQRRVRALIDYKSIQGSLACLRVHHLRNPLEYTTVLVTDCTVTRLQLELQCDCNVVAAQLLQRRRQRQLVPGLVLEPELGLGPGLERVAAADHGATAGGDETAAAVAAIPGAHSVAGAGYGVDADVDRLKDWNGEASKATATGSVRGRDEKERPIVVCARMHAAASECFSGTVSLRNVTESKYACFMIKILASSFSSFKMAQQSFTSGSVMLLTTDPPCVLIVRTVAGSIAVVSSGTRGCGRSWVAVAASSHQPTKADLSSVTPISRCCLLVLGLLHINAWSTLIMSVRITARDFELVVDTLNKPLR
ncbi:hypothetical protein KCU87_g247, partial [Aureobasidium melanogenum]